MAGDNVSWKERKVRFAEEDLFVVEVGEGRPLLVLHEELGHPGILRWHRELGKEYRLVIPMHPGFGRSPQREWMTNVRDLACFYGWYVRENLAANAGAIGFSFGGWVGAEMVANDPKLFPRLILVAPMGIRPAVGEIMDMFKVTARAYLAATVLNPQTTPEFKELYGGAPTPEQFEAFEDARAQTARLAWQPYAYNPSLPHLLKAVTDLPTLLIWGRQDNVVPLNAGELYAAAIKQSRLVTLEGCGHRPEIEKTDEFLREVRSFLS